MQSPFDSKNPLAAALDRFALCLLLFTASTGYFFFLWNSARASLLAGGALFSLLLLTLLLIERRTLLRRELMLRERVGGAIFLDDLLLMPSKDAAKAVCDLLCRLLNARCEAPGVMRYEGETWLVRCAQCMDASAAGAGDVLSAHRARIEAGAQRCALASTTHFTAEAIRCAEWVDPPIRLITGRQLCAAAGKLHPATDEDIAAHAKRRRTPFTRARIRALAFSPGKTRRYLLCSFLLLVIYLSSGSLAALVFMLGSFLLALFCRRAHPRGLSL